MGFYVGGECVCVLVYGVNCFGINFLLDFLVFGKLVGDVVVEDLKIGCVYCDLLKDVVDCILVCISVLDNCKGGVNV